MQGRRNRNRDAVRRFVVFWDGIFPASAGSTFNLQCFDSKPESSPPLPDTDRVWDYIEEPSNAEAAKYLSPHFARLKREHPPLYVMLGIVGGWVKPLQLEEPDHSTLRRWEAGETPEDRFRYSLFNRALSKVEEYLNDAHPNLEIRVVIPRRDEPVESKVQAAYEERKWETENSLRQLHRDWCILHYLNDYSSEAARYEVGEWHDVSPKKVERAITHCNKELKERRLFISRYFVDKSTDEGEARWNEAV